MPNQPTAQNIEDFSPYTLLGNFTKNRVLPFIFVAAIIHVVVIGGLSCEFIYYTWIDPSANPAKLAGVEGPDESTGTPADTGSTEASANGDATAAAASQDGDGGEAAKTSDDPLDAPVVREITEKADPDEIPDKPDDFGISIDDTNP